MFINTYPYSMCFSKFTFNPENFECSNNTSSVAFKELLLPSETNDVSSAYCDIFLVVYNYTSNIFIISYHYC